MTRSTPVEVCFSPDAQYVISGKYLTVWFLQFFKLYSLNFARLTFWHSYTALLEHDLFSTFLLQTFRVFGFVPSIKIAIHFNTT